MLFEYLSIVFFISTKWLIGVVLILSGDRSFWESMAWCIGGGMTAVWVYTYLGYLGLFVWRTFYPVQENKLRMTRIKRIIVKIRQRHGLAGIALLTPVLLTVPIGTFAANIIEPSKKIVMAYMLIAFTMWSSVFCGLEAWLQLDVLEWLKLQFR
jgi:hypothetical protein